MGTLAPAIVSRWHDATAIIEASSNRLPENEHERRWPLDDMVLDFDPDALREKYKQERDKRVRADGNNQYVEVTGKFAHFVDDHYVEPGLHP
jgi:hypothetical protein